jgi:hypothetical protein
MFKKRECTKCRRKISKDYRFCPHCGFGDRDFEEGDWGMLGKDDLTPQNNFQMPMGLNTIFNSLMKTLNNQMNDAYSPKKNSDPKIKNNGISISISTKGNNAPRINTNPQEHKKRIVKRIPGQFSKENAKRFSKLPKKESKTNVRRLSNRVIYEIEMPGVRSTRDISIIRLESGFEIKAIADDKAYFKKISINFPIMNYDLLGEKLILEFGIKG